MLNTQWLKVGDDIHFPGVVLPINELNFLIYTFSPSSVFLMVLKGNHYSSSIIVTMILVVFQTPLFHEITLKELVPRLNKYT